MSTPIKLTVMEGMQPQKEFVFDQPSVCAVGRSDDCDVHIPNDGVHMNVSRHHCVLTIDPPEVTVRDCGSRNGTYINGVKIGQRARTQQAEEGSLLAMPEYRLYDGDRLRVGDTVFRVQVGGPAICSKCGRDIPERLKEQARVGRREYLCAWCQEDEEAGTFQEMANSH